MLSFKELDGLLMFNLISGLISIFFVMPSIILLSLLGIGAAEPSLYSFLGCIGLSCMFIYYPLYTIDRLLAKYCLITVAASKQLTIDSEEINL
jgi:hypothetical protein